MDSNSETTASKTFKVEFGDDINLFDLNARVGDVVSYLDTGWKASDRLLSPTFNRERFRSAMNSL